MIHSGHHLEHVAENANNPCVCIHCGEMISDATLTSSLIEHKAVCHRCAGRTCPKCGRETLHANNEGKGVHYCPRHGGPKLMPSRWRRMPKFEPTLVSDAKRRTRADFYLLAEKILREECRVDPSSNTVSSLILPGRAPDEEIRAIRALFPHAYVVAVDRDPEAVKRAMTAGADKGAVGDLAYINNHDEHGGLGLRYHNFSVVNLDLCGVANNTSMDIVTRVAKRASKVLGVFVSYGHDDAEQIAYNTERLALFPGWGPLREELRALMPETQVTRTIEITRSALVGGLGDWTVRKVYQYRGNRVPMLGVVLARGGPGLPVTYSKFKDSDLRSSALAVAKYSGQRGLASSLFGISEARLAAWKAVETRLSNQAL